MTSRNPEAREHLYAIFGNDIEYLPGELDVAARHHREAAQTLRHREPDALITDIGAQHLADHQDYQAERCDRIADVIRAALAGIDLADTTTAPAGRRPLVVTVTADLALRAAVDAGKFHARVDVVHNDSAPKARTGAVTAQLVIVGVDMAHWFPQPIRSAGTTVVAGFEPLDRVAAAEHAARLAADLFVLRPDGQATLKALLHKVPGAAQATA